MSDDSHIEVLPVPEGSIIWLHNVQPQPPSGDNFDIGAELHRVLDGRIGHDKYVVLTTEGDAVVDVLGEDELVSRVRAALEDRT